MPLPFLMERIMSEYTRLSQSHPHAQKNYRCDSCGWVIYRGVRYLKDVRVKHDHELLQLRFHTYCIWESDHPY